MALNGKNLGDEIADLITDSNASEEMKTQIKQLWESIGQAITNHIVNNLEVKASVPSQSVIVAVTGGSGAPAVGTSNITPINNEVTVS